MTPAYTIAAYPKEIHLREGTRITVRPLQRGDDDELLHFFLTIPEDERFFLKDDVTSPAVISRWVQELDYQRALPLVAYNDGRMIAEAVLVRRRGNARSHIGEVRVLVATDYRSRGLGTLLIRELCEVADDAGLDKVLIEVVADKEAEALKAAEWLGFIRIGTMDGGARDQDGHLHDVVTLAMPLGKWYQWTKY